jgi:hypothetical protein
MTAPENSRSQPGGAESRLNGQSLVKKLPFADPKIIFPKNQKLALYTATVQTHPSSSGIDRSLCKIQNIPSKVCAKK